MRWLGSDFQPTKTMNIEMVLKTALNNHIMQGGREPSAVYLGSREERALEMEMAKVPIQVAGYPPRAKWHGLSVYRVNAEHHIAFA